MNPRFRDYFHFTTGERNGTVVLLLLIIFVGIFSHYQDKFITLPETDFAQSDAFFDSIKPVVIKAGFDSVITGEPKQINLAEEAGEHSVFHKKEYFYFNPNKLDPNDWIRLGLSPGQARVVKNFEKKGGKFETKEDVKKLFVISAELYNELEPFIVLPEKIVKKQEIKSGYVRKAQQIIELNTADSTRLVEVKGIGPVFAKRIIAYRAKLGGFNNVLQLKEVYGINEENFQRIAGSVTADSTQVRKINVNSAGITDLKRHPYIGPGVAQALVNYRNEHGEYESIADIKKCDLVSADLYSKIAPYLTN